MRRLYSIRSETDSTTITADAGDTILAASLRAGIAHTHVCGGHARCSTCRVAVLDGLAHCHPRNAAEQQLSDKLQLPSNIRLACQTQIAGDITIRRPVVDDLDIEIITKQFQDPSGTKLGQEKQLAILFTDIVNYTAFAEAFPAYDVVHVLNRYYQSMNRIIEAHRGVISDVAGDGILALFGVLGESANPVRDAIDAVRAMHTALHTFNDYLQPMYGWQFGIRAGIHFGTVIVGTFDTGMMKKVAAIGDAVNMASRIETANKALGTRLLISEPASQQVPEWAGTLQTYRVPLKGKTGEYVLYEIEL